MASAEPNLKEGKRKQASDLGRKNSGRTLVKKDSEKSPSDKKEVGEIEKRESVSEKVAGENPRVQRKFIENWRHACDRTKDRTKELLKKWTTMPETGEDPMQIPTEEHSGWSEHVWTTWVKRCPSSEVAIENVQSLTQVQSQKFHNFFEQFFDLDRDEVISLTDFEAFFERLRHFADWSKNSAEHHRLLEVQKGFIESFLLPAEVADSVHSYDALEKMVKKEQIEFDIWLKKWSLILTTGNFYSLPLWLQYFPTILFQVINRSGNGNISESELGTFYKSVLGLTDHQLTECLKSVYGILTSRGAHCLNSDVFRLVFANFIFGRFPNGPGQFLFNPLCGDQLPFPIDYKALSCAPQDLETYSPRVQTDRRSVVV